MPIPSHRRMIAGPHLTPRAVTVPNNGDLA